MVSGSRRIAIIPARGGSKRIPRKNVIDFAGKPMIAWTIDAALSSQQFAQVVVSTDDEEIAGIARACGAAVPFLRSGHADDVAPVSMATLATLEQMDERGYGPFDVVVQLMANCPLRNAGQIRGHLAAFEASGSAFQISCTRFGWLNPWWAFRRTSDGLPAWVFPDAITRRSQDLEPLYCPTGAIWIARVPSLLESRTFYGPGVRFEPLHWTAAIDIDDEDDLAMARVLCDTNFVGQRSGG
ncbi:acylneuraminate cytidylyltransferase family protein [Nostoc sp. NIES-2111]